MNLYPTFREHDQIFDSTVLYFIVMIIYDRNKYDWLRVNFNNVHFLLNELMLLHVSQSPSLVNHNFGAI